MKSTCVILILLFFIACSNQKKENKEDVAVLDKEINKRLDSLRLHPDLLSVENFDADSVHKRVQDLILMSKDVENISASVKLGNQFFSDLIQKQNLNGAMMLKIESEMTQDQINYVIKQNELWILNQVVLQKLNQSIQLTPAY